MLVCPAGVSHVDVPPDGAEVPWLNKLTPPRTVFAPLVPSAAVVHASQYLKKERAACGIRLSATGMLLVP